MNNEEQYVNWKDLFEHCKGIDKEMKERKQIRKIWEAKAKKRKQRKLRKKSQGR